MFVSFFNFVIFQAIRVKKSEQQEYMEKLFREAKSTKDSGTESPKEEPFASKSDESGDSVEDLDAILQRNEL